MKDRFALRKIIIHRDLEEENAYFHRWFCDADGIIIGIIELINGNCEVYQMGRIQFVDNWVKPNER